MTPPEALWANYAERFCSGNLDSWAELWQADGQFTVAYPLTSGSPTMNGTQEILKGVKGLARLVKNISISDSTVFTTNNPDTFFVEYTLSIQGRAREPYTSPIVAKITLKDGKIAEIFEYYDSLAYKRFLATMGF